MLRPTPVQAACVPRILAGDDVLGAAPTGSGEAGRLRLACNALLCAHVCARAFAGKCLARDTPLLLHDGRVKLVQDVRVGDQVRSTSALLLVAVASLDRFLARRVSTHTRRQHASSWATTRRRVA